MQEISNCFEHVESDCCLSLLDAPKATCRDLFHGSRIGVRAGTLNAGEAEAQKSQDELQRSAVNADVEMLLFAQAE